MIADQIYYECTASNCLAGMEIFRDFNNKKKVHRVSFEAPVAKFSHIKKGNMIPGMKCYKCDQEKLIRV
jgi:hypothetical protein